MKASQGRCGGHAAPKESDEMVVNFWEITVGQIMVCGLNTIENSHCHSSLFNNAFYT
jgi:hypothetical protein